MSRSYRIIGAASGWGAQIRDCEEGPQILKQDGLMDRLIQSGNSIKGWETLLPLQTASEIDIPLKTSLPLICDFNLRLSEIVKKTIDQSEFPVILGGDHSIAVGTWNGVAEGCCPLGLIWIDAHMDAHTEETTPSGAWHGMPLAALLGFGNPKMTHLKRQKAILSPEHLCLVGSRSFEEGEFELLKKLQVKIVFMEEVKSKGIKAVLQEAISHVSKGTKGFGVSLDLDVVDPSDAPGVGSPEKDGVLGEDLIKALKIFKNNSNLKAFEIVEYNPKRDVRHKTGQLCLEILKAVL